MGKAREQGDASSPWRKQIRRANESAVFSELQLKKMVYEFYEKKLFADKVDDEKNNPRDSMPEFVEEHLQAMYGMGKLASQKLQMLVNSMHYFHLKWFTDSECSSDPRVAIFARMTGTVTRFDPSTQTMAAKPYTPGICDLVLEILGRVFTDWMLLAEILENAKVGGALCGTE